MASRDRWACSRRPLESYERLDLTPLMISLDTPLSIRTHSSRNMEVGVGTVSAVQRLIEAINDHDLERMVSCFASGYVNETPAHPLRSFTGNEQVRTNWSQIFASVP